MGEFITFIFIILTHMFELLHFFSSLCVLYFPCLSIQCLLHWYCSRPFFFLLTARFFTPWIEIFFFWFEIIYHLCGYFTAYMNNSLLFMNTNYIIYPLPFCYVECFLSCFYSHDFGSTSLCSTRFTQSVPFLTICMVDYILYYF